ncbi:serine/threonine protein kinase [Leptolyngbya sp. GGD]|uniref:serine/threonine protein kinase n=1 Tax=Leptolyngbya sp. GGD TaxID=2997907 RepID=UPI002279FA4A|nr:serine/threonine-protein kinase [Leptolyngbya sp. GGD]MCY6489255.1 serine/threonine-protein kinase [Leptolyngbya sp. GGD]
MTNVLQYLSLGQKLQKGEYTIERELGRGRFCIAYLAQRSNGERWVIKILNPHVMAGLTSTERDRLETMFWQEAVKLAKCSSTPHIVTVEMPFKEGTVICLPMEYVDGNSLGDRAQRILLESTALEYVQQIGEALTVAHGQKLIHRDVRPANIFLRIRGSKAEAVLADFGLAVACETEQSRTRELERMDGFSPIELYSRGQAVGDYTDVYSLAATLYELLTGEVPVSAEARKVRGEALISPQVMNPEISGRTTKAILKGMELLPERRSQSISDWLKLLGVEKQRESPVKEATNWEKWQAIWAALAVIVALGMGIPAWLALNKPDPPPTPPEKPTVQPSAKSTR